MSSTAENQTTISSPQIANFGVILPGKLYRSQYPELENYKSLVDLNIKTVLTLVLEPNAAYEEFLSEHNIKHITIALPANKDQILMDFRDVLSALYVVLNTRNYPLLIHCNKGKHRTGCVVACVERVLGHSEEKVLATYHEYARGKARLFDMQFIRSFPEEVRQSLQCRFLSPVDAPEETFSKLPEEYQRFLEPISVFKTLTNGGK
jgi:protein tyrosine/serine phosphatase